MEPNQHVYPQFNMSNQFNSIQIANAAQNSAVKKANAFSSGLITNTLGDLYQPRDDPQSQESSKLDKNNRHGFYKGRSDSLIYKPQNSPPHPAFLYAGNGGAMQS